MSYPGSHPYDSSTDPKNSNPNHPMFASQQQHAQQSFYRTTSRDSPQSWPPYDQTSLSPFDSQPFPHRSFPTPTPYTATPCSPSLNNTPVPSASRLSIAGSFDPTTGIFCRMPEHPRLRTAQACEKCRMRKAKCSGEHPSCKRCLNRGLRCEYAKEGRVRGPNRAKSTSVSSSKNTSVSATVDPEQSSTMKNTASSVEQPRSSSHTRDGTKTRDAYVPNEENSQKFPSASLEPPRVPSPPRIDALAMSHNASSSRINTLSQRLYPSSISVPLVQPSGLGHRRHSHPRPFNLGINYANPWRQESNVHIGSSQTKWVDRSGIGLDLVGTELGIGAQGSQFGRQPFAKQQHGGYLLEQQQQQRPAFQQHRQDHGTLPHQHSAPSLLDYQQTQALQQPLSYPAFPIQQQQGTNRVNMYQSQYNAYPPMARNYDNQEGMGYLLSAIGQGRGYLTGPSRREVTDLGLLPSLSRRAPKSTEQIASETLKEESTFTDHQASATQDVEIEEAHGDQTVKWG